VKRIIIVIIVILAVGIGVGAYYYAREKNPPQVMTANISRGDITEAVSATGTLEAVTTVQVGTQVSGTIQSLGADFNSIVHKGQVVARLDPALFQTQIEQARANLVRAQADTERNKVAVDDAARKLKRAEDLAARKLVAPADLETAQVELRSAQAQLQSAQAQVTQAQASLNQNEVSLEHTVIEAPIDGIVIARNVDVGQTVAASFQSPTLFVIAADLTKMQVNANIDEADVGRIRPGQNVMFRVDAYPAEDFQGTVSQIRLQPQTVQNVVTYSTVISVPNIELRLKPGMTANVQIQIARRTNVLRVPNMALRFRPTTDIFAALGQEPPPEFARIQQGGAGGNGRGQNGVGNRPGQGGQGTGAQPSGNAPATGGPRPRGTSGDEAPQPQSTEGQQPSPQPQAGAQGQAEGSANMSDEERRRRFEERMKNATPEEREQMMQRMREWQQRQRGQGGAPAGQPQPGRSVQGAQPPAAAPQAGAAAAQRTQSSTNRPPANAQHAQTIDALFGPLPETQSFGRVWRYVDGKLTSVRVRLGVTDGTNTELVSGDLPDNTPVVTGVQLSATPSATTGGQRSSSPLMPQRPGGPGGHGPGGH
jgi:HlyD family secretion protein